MNGVQGLGSNAAELRRAFDASFALPAATAEEQGEDLLAIRVVGHEYAIRLRDITGIVAGCRVVPVPSMTPDFLGLAGIRSDIVPVFGLSSILGHEGTSDSPRWMMLCGAEEPIALGFSDFDGFLRVPKAALHVDDNPAGPRRYVREIAHTDTGVRAVIGISLIVTKIRNPTGRGRLAKEPRE